MQGTNSNNLLLSSLYLQKMTKYLHLINMSDLNLNHIPTFTGSNFLNFYQAFQSDLKHLNLVLFLSTKSTYNLSQDNGFNFYNKDSFFHKCVTNSKVNKAHSYILDARLLKQLPFLFQKEFTNIIKRNLELGKENK